MNFDAPKVETIATSLMLCTAQDIENLEKKLNKDEMEE
jgi:hypothetical protein